MLAQSLDFITPIVDDPFTYGQIAAANSLSDVFAKGAKAISAMSIFMWDKTHLNTDEANEILQGALNKLIECKCPLIGGHSINDSEQKFGLSVTGRIFDNIYYRNNTAQIGDKIILTKPIGSGILSSAMKNGKLEFSKNMDVVKSMLMLNSYAMDFANKFEIHAASDVTGFGLLGHMLEMINSDISINLYLDNIKLFDKVIDFAKSGIIPGGSHKNKSTLESRIKNDTNIDDIIYYDAQTSGGLLIALDYKNANELNKILNNEGIDSSIIAECIEKREFDIYLR